MSVNSLLVELAPKGNNSLTGRGLLITLVRRFSLKDREVWDFLIENELFVVDWWNVDAKRSRSGLGVEDFLAGFADVEGGG
jgi:hypothetical protein